ncbi:MAG: hypothetical protein PHY43_04715 [Verrucomicrobiales bacterium]|nr:hypothetical protein [Verrucomicrobiales bacterium]
MKMKSFLVLILSLPFLAGCATKHYSEFTGSRTWLTTKNAVADQAYAVPVYWNWPERPYRVMGSIQLADPHKKWKDSDTAQSARMARSKGGDALIVFFGDEPGGISNAPHVMQLFPTAPACALVIQWKSQSDVDEESHRLDGLRAYLRRSYPALNLGIKNDLWEMGVEYVAWLGLNISVPRGATKLEDALSSLMAASKDASPSKWLFKGTLRANDHSTTPTETVVYGIATFTQTGENVAIVSQPGKINASFHGLTRDGQVSGRLDFAAGATVFTGQAEGLQLPDKISMSSQGQVAGKPVQGTFLLLR